MFQVGDFVVCRNSIDHISVGDMGCVCKVTSFGYGVRWDTYHEDQHDCDGQCELGQGWFVDESIIELVQSNDQEDTELPPLDSIL